MSAGDTRHNHRELVQQWQYLGKVHKELLSDNAFLAAKDAGITAVQSYVPWSEVEREEGRFDFSIYDDLIGRLKKHGLKWVPFLILGPYYSIPDWFHSSGESLYAKCLEHDIESKIQSIWNPAIPGRVERFIKAFSEHFDASYIESVLLGISGNWGEAIYPSSGGFTGGFHTHRGWWCGDGFAKESYRLFLHKSYGSIDKLNNRYGSRYRDFDEIGLHSLPVSSKNKTFTGLLLRKVRGIFFKLLRLATDRLGMYGVYAAFFSLFRRRESVQWIDFVRWYQGEMTHWAEIWLASARRHFPRSRIYLVTGGAGEPESGAVFSHQLKVAKKYDAGIRITNQINEFSESFILTRLVSTASRFYKSFFVTEEALMNSPEGVLARVFDAATSGACGLYCKSIIGIGFDLCSKREYPAGKPTVGAEYLKNYSHLINVSEPLIDVAVLCPDTSMAFENRMSFIFRQCSELREHIDLDLIDETMIADGILQVYRYLVLFDCDWLRGKTIRMIDEWVRGGGILICSKISVVRNIDDLHEKLVFKIQNKKVAKHGRGFVLYFGKKDRDGYLHFITEMLENKGSQYPHAGMTRIDRSRDRVFASYFKDRVLLYNAGDEQSKKLIVSPANNEIVSVSVPPRAILAVD